jgi:hypothetical protein
MKKILYIISTASWSTKERFALKDLLMAKENGNQVFLLAKLNSYLAKEAMDHGVEVIPFEEHFINRFFSFHKHFNFSKIITDRLIDIIHCYDFNLLFSLAFQLRRFPLTSLVITQDHSIDKPLQRFLYRPIISRIDFLILANKNLMSDTLGNLGLPLKKVEYYGMGLQILLPKLPEEVEEQFGLYKNFFLVGTHLSPEITDLKNIEPLLYALRVLNHDKEESAKSKLVLITSSHFKNLKILPMIKTKIEELGLHEDILFVSTMDIDGVIPKINLWVSNCEMELIEDYSMVALLHEVPVILARNFCTLELLKNHEGVGESYKLHDARELREKWQKIMLAENVYIGKIRLFKFFLEREHDYKNYRRDLLHLYNRMSARR